jgi:hypothetical protein
MFKKAILHAALTAIPEQTNRTLVIMSPYLPDAIPFNFGDGKWTNDRLSGPSRGNSTADKVSSESLISGSATTGASAMTKTSTNDLKRKKTRPKIKLGIPDLEHSKAAAVLREEIRFLREDRGRGQRGSISIPYNCPIGMLSPYLPLISPAFEGDFSCLHPFICFANGRYKSYPYF